MMNFLLFSIYSANVIDCTWTNSIVPHSTFEQMNITLVLYIYTQNTQLYFLVPFYTDRNQSHHWLNQIYFSIFSHRWYLWARSPSRYSLPIDPSFLNRPIFFAFVARCVYEHVLFDIYFLFLKLIQTLLHPLNLNCTLHPFFHLFFPRLHQALLLLSSVY